MKKIVMMAMAVGLAFGISGCVKNPDIDGPGGKDGDKAKMGISFTLPAKNTRAETVQPALPDESFVTTVSVFLFDDKGVALDVPTGGHASFVLNDFTQTGLNYTLNDGKEIETIAGENHRIYVAVNVPAAKDISHGTESALLAAIASTGDMDDAKEFTMFSTVQTRTLPEYDENNTAGQGGSNATVETVKCSVDRVVSKVVATTAAANFQADAWSNGVVLNYVPKQYNVYQEAIDSYLVKGSATSSLFYTTFDEDYKKGGTVGANKAVLQTPATQAEYTDLPNGFYIGENDPTESNPVASPSLHGNTTFAFVATQVEVKTKTASYNSTTGKVEWEGPATTIGTTLYIIPVGTATYIVAHDATKDVTPGTENPATQTVLTDVCNALGTIDDKGTSDTSDDVLVPAEYYTYTQGFVHFPVFLNPDGVKGTPGYTPNHYVIGRNQFIHLKINGVKALDGVFGGYPGDPDEPEKPIDPTDPDSPDPWDPDEPVDGSPAMLDVEFDINPWSYVENPTILGY